MSVTHDDCTQCAAILTTQIQKVACGNTCHECGRYAYHADEPSYLYLLTNQKLQLHKIGIGTVGKDKNHLQKLSQAGWIVHGLWHEDNKAKTFYWEQEIFRQLQVKVATATPESPVLVGRSDRNWVESISASAISVNDLAQLMLKVLASKVK
jgi:hypothetical protein